jgi:HK97 family phage major capsid protein
MVEIARPRCIALIDISQQNLEDSAFDLEAELRFEAIRAVRGQGGRRVRLRQRRRRDGGLPHQRRRRQHQLGAATTIKDANGQADGLITLKHSIKSAYARNATWALNRTTLGSVRKLKDGTGDYIWMPGIAMGKPNTIDGDPYVEVPDMPNEGAGTYPIAYGDFQRAYTLVDRIAMQLLRDPYTQATSGNIRFLFRRRVGGAVVLAEAIPS